MAEFVTKAEMDKALKEQEENFKKMLRDYCRVQGCKKIVAYS